MKKKLLVFILCFTLSTCGFIHYDPVKEIKADAIVAPLSFVILGLTAIGFNYYSQAAASSLENDIEIYASNNNTTSATFLNAFQSVVVDVAKNAVKFSAAQIYLLKEFANSLINRKAVSYEPITTNSLQYLSVAGYPRLYRISGGSTFYVESSDGTRLNFNVVYNSADITGPFYIIFASRTDNGQTALYPLIYSGTAGYSGVWPNVYQGTDNLFYNSSVSSSPSYPNMRSKSGTHHLGYYYFDSLGNTVNIKLNGHVFAPFDNSLNTSDLIYHALNFTSAPVDSVPTVVLPSYSVDRTVFDNIASDKDLVITSPDLIDKAVDNAIVRNPSATAVTADDIAVAIDDTAVGVIDPAAEDEDERVIAPPIALDDDLSISQDTAITDTVVEDLDIGEPVPPPDPPPVDPPIIDNALASKFPFSIFADFVLLMELFDATPEAPTFPLGFEFMGNTYEFTIDLSDFDSVARVLRLMELISFIGGLVFLTIRYIRGKD